MTAGLPDLNLLPILIALYDELSVSGAGNQLGMSQPSVSKALRRMREAFGDQLFVRGPHGLVPTPRAHAIVRAARPHLKQLANELLAEETFEPERSTRPITLAISDIAEMAFFPSIIVHFRRHAPHCPIRTVSLPADDLAAGLESGEIDVAGGYMPALARRNFRSCALSRHGFACLLRSDHPLREARLAADDYGAAEHIGVHRPGSSQDLLERYLQRKKLQLNVVVRVSHVMSVPFIVIETDLIATLPFAVATRFASLCSEVRAALPPFDLRYDLTLHWHRRFDNESRSIWIREQLARVFANHRWLEAPKGPSPFVRN